MQQIPRVMPGKFREVYAGTMTGWWTKIMELPPSPERATKLVDKLEADIARFPFAAAEMPPEVAAARDAFVEAVATARAATDEVIRAHESTKAAQEADIRATADAMKAGAKQPALTQTKARQLEDTALVALQAAEKIVAEAHLVLTDAIRDAWAKWRRSLVQAGDEEHAKAVAIFNQAREAVAQRRAAYGAVIALDREVVARYQEVLPRIKQERRRGLPLYEAAVEPFLVSPWPAAYVAKLEEALDQVKAHLLTPVSWASEWNPPDDPEHARLLAAPVDTTAAWVRACQYDAFGLTCKQCGAKLPSDTPLDPETFEPVHTDCTGKPQIAEVPARYRIGPKVG